MKDFYCNETRVARPKRVGKSERKTRTRAKHEKKKNEKQKAKNEKQRLPPPSRGAVNPSSKRRDFENLTTYVKLQNAAVKTHTHTHTYTREGRVRGSYALVPGASFTFCRAHVASCGGARPS